MANTRLPIAVLQQRTEPKKRGKAAKDMLGRTPGHIIQHEPGLSEPKRDSASRRAAVDHMTAHPWATIKVWPSKIANTFGAPNDATYWGFQKVTDQLVVPGAGDDKKAFLFFKRYGAWHHTFLMLMFVASIFGAIAFAFYLGFIFLGVLRS